MTPVKLRFAMALMGHPETKVSTLCQELGITRQTLYRHILPDGQLRADGKQTTGKTWGSGVEPHTEAFVRYRSGHDKA